MSEEAQPVTVLKITRTVVLDVDLEQHMADISPELLAAMQRRVDIMTAALLSQPPAWEPEPVPYKPPAPTHWLFGAPTYAEYQMIFANLGV